MALQLNRYNSIYPNRESALDVLKSISRSYSECVTIRYYEKDSSEIGIILVIYKSNKKGDFEVIFESSEKVIETSFRIFKTTRQYEGQSDKECINNALFGETPVDRDMVIISSVSENSTITYIYFNKTWTRIGSDGSEINVKSSNTVSLTVAGEGIDRAIQADVNIDNKSLVFDEQVKGIRVGIIYGGTF